MEGNILKKRNVSFGVNPVFIPVTEQTEVYCGGYKVTLPAGTYHANYPIVKAENVKIGEPIVLCYCGGVMIVYGQAEAVRLCQKCGNIIGREKEK